MENYSEMLRGNSTTCSIPFLDLPSSLQQNYESSNGGLIGYSEIFSGFNGKEFGVNFQDLLKESSASSNERVQMDPEFCQQIEFSNTTEGAGANNFFPNILHNDPIDNVTYNGQLNDVEQGKVTSSTYSTENTDPKEFYTKHAPVEYLTSKEDATNDVTYMKISDINLPTNPSIAKMPPKIVSKQENTKFSKSFKANNRASLLKHARDHRIQYKVGAPNSNRSSTFLNKELDANSAAAAMKEAMEQAQARLKNAKELMGIKQDSIKSCKQLGHKESTKFDERKEVIASEDGKTFNEKTTKKEYASNDLHKITKVAKNYNENKRHSVKTAENQHTRQEIGFESSQMNYKLVEESIEWKSEEQFYDLINIEKPRLEKETSTPNIDSKVNETIGKGEIDDNSKACKFPSKNEIINTQNKSKQGNHHSSKVVISGDLRKPNSIEQISCGENITNVESLNVISSNNDLKFKESSHDDESIVLHVAKEACKHYECTREQSCNEDNNFSNCTTKDASSVSGHIKSGPLITAQQDSMPVENDLTNEVAKDIEELKENSEAHKSALDSEKSTESEHEKEISTKAVEERETEREREKDRPAAERVTHEAHERACAEAREKEERISNESRQRARAEAWEKKAKAEASERSLIEKALKEVKLQAERAAVERATAEARERAVAKALADARLRHDKLKNISRGKKKKDKTAGEYLQNATAATTSGVTHDAASLDTEVLDSFRRYGEVKPPLRCKTTLERHRRTFEYAENVLAEKNMRDILAQREQEERNRLAESLDTDIKKWSTGKEGNLRALLSTLHYILGPDSGWQPILVTDVIISESIKKAYRKATLCVHPDKLQQRGASVQQKYICEKVFELLKEAWNRFNSEERERIGNKDV